MLYVVATILRILFVCNQAKASSLSQVTSQSLAVSFGPILMCHSKFEALAHIPKPIEILKYLIDLWPPKPQSQQPKSEPAPSEYSGLDGRSACL